MNSHATPHGSELLELHAARTEAHVTRLDKGFLESLVKRGFAAINEGPDLAAFDGAAGLASILASAGSAQHPASLKMCEK